MAFLAIPMATRLPPRDAARYLADLAWERRAALQGDVPSPDRGAPVRRRRAARARSC